MKKYIGFVVALLLPLSGFAGHHEESEPAIQYVLTQGIKADNAPASAGAAAKFLQSGVLGKRGVGMGLYGLNASSGNGATMAIDYYYPNAASLPPADVQTVSPPHVAFFDEMRELGNETVYSTIMSTVVEVAPQSTIGVNKVFYLYYLTVTDPAGYVVEWKKLMKAMTKEGMAPTSYGLREIVAGGENGETHMIWMGYPSMQVLMELYHKSNNSDLAADFRTKAASMRTLSRTAIASQLALDTAQMFD